MSKRTTPTPVTSQESGPPGPARRRRRLFIIASLLAPIVLLAVLEGVLRLSGMGGYPSVVHTIGRSSRGTMLITDNAGAATYFDKRRTNPGTLNPTTFLTPKPSGTVRVVLAGESAIEGFPQPMGWTAGAFLEQMLSAAWPGKRVEVINLGTTAVASFAVLDMLTQVLPYEVDLVVIYAGHNEFYGAYGVASAHRAGGSPPALRLRRALGRSALMQALERLGGSGPSQNERHTLMEDVVQEATIPADSPYRATARRNLESHVTEMIARSRQAGAAVVVCIPAVNEAGLAPIGCGALETMPEVQRRAVEAQLAAAEASDAPAAIEKLREAEKAAPADAGIQFRLGIVLRASGRAREAAAAFRSAVDLDTMPWRLTSDEAEVLQRVAQAAGVILCDTAAEFRAASPEGCTGWELLDDHVHPTLRGQWLLARSIAKSLSRAEGPMRVDAAALDAQGDYDAVAAHLDLNPYDTYTSVVQLERVFGVPFMKRSNPEAYQRFADEKRRAFEAMPSFAQAEAKRWEKPETHPGFRVPLSGMVGRVLARENRMAEAAALFAAARRHVPTYNGLQFEYTFFMLAFRKDANKTLSTEEAALARTTIGEIQEFMELSDRTSGQPQRYMGRLLQLLGEEQAAIAPLLAARRKLSGPDALAVDMALIEAYMTTGQAGLARDIALRGAATGGSYAEAYRRALDAIPGDAGRP